MSRKRISMAAALAFTGGFLWMAARNVQFSDLGSILASAQWRWLAPMLFVIGIVDIGLRALRWRILLSRAVKSAPLGELFRLSAIGLAVNNVLFARLGEVLRGVLAARQLKIPLATTLASVVVERALDVAALLTLFVLASAGQPDMVAAPIRRAGMLLLAGVVLVLVFFVLAERTLESGGFLERRFRKWPKLHEIVGHLALGAAVLRQPRALAAVVALSLGLWSVDAGIYWLGAQALGLGGTIDYLRAILVLSWAGAGAAIPAVPGAIGTFEAMVKAILEKFGVAANPAFAYALFLHMSMYVTVTVMGLIFLYRVGLSLGGLKASLGRPEGPRA
ncbi:MAG: lysylphosphatidylglycerol synthase transmembrane domain-containing protein [Elusimicrobiota bacterium]